MRSIPQEHTIDMVMLNAIAAHLKALEPTNTSLHGALDRALDHVRAGRWWRLDGNTLTVQSASRPTDAHVCTVDACPCQTQQGVCWHRALAAAAVAASTLRACATACVPLAAPPRRRRVAEPRVSVGEIRARVAAQPQRSYAEIQALVDDLY